MRHLVVWWYKVERLQVSTGVVCSRGVARLGLPDNSLCFPFVSNFSVIILW